MAVYDYGYGIHTANLNFRKGAIAKLIRRYGDNDIREELNNYLADNADSGTPKEELEEEFISEEAAEDNGPYEGSGEIGCIVRMLNTSPNPKIWHGFCYDGEFLYYPSRFPESPTDRAKIPTLADIEESIRCFVNATTVDVTEEFVYDFADDDC